MTTSLRSCFAHLHSLIEPVHVPSWSWYTLQLEEVSFLPQDPWLFRTGGSNKDLDPTSWVALAVSPVCPSGEGIPGCSCPGHLRTWSSIPKTRPAAQMRMTQPLPTFQQMFPVGYETSWPGVCPGPQDTGSPWPLVGY